MAGPRRILSAEERLDWLRLIRTDGVGPSIFNRLIARFGSAAAALEALPGLSSGSGGERYRPVPRASAERELEQMDRAGARMIGSIEPDYPPLLREIDGAPPLITVRGNPGLLARNAVGMVGARNASLNGKRMATDLARDLGAAGLVIVSGFARGIDAAAHEGALASGTVAVLPGGIDVVYPPEHRALYDRIAESGVLVAECAFGTQPQARHFPRRNRIISGLSLAVVVVEAALRSGSLITARFAAEQGRDVFAVPGFPRDPRAQGCNELIRNGATLIQGADDVLEGLRGIPFAPVRTADGPESPPVAAPLPEDYDPASVRAAILERLSPTPTPVDELVRDCQFSPAVVQTVLLELELDGRVERQPGNRIVLL